jgi:phospholipase/carboxylesterase
MPRTARFAPSLFLGLQLLRLALLSGCSRGPVAVPYAVRSETWAGVPFLVLFGEGADRQSPLLVALHGEGATPEAFANRLFPELPAGYQVALPQGSIRSGAGWTWFDWAPGMSEDQLTDAIESTERRLWDGIAALAHGRKVVVTGFSQGGVLTFALAADHPWEIPCAFPIAGFLPPGLVPTAGNTAAPVYALHGTADRWVEIRRDRETVAGFRYFHNRAALREFPGVGHDITAAMREDLLTHLLEIRRHPDRR